MPEQRDRLFRASLVRLVRRGAWGNATKLLEKSHPADIAEVLDRLTETDRKAVFHLIASDDARAEVLALLEFAEGADLISGLEPEAAARLISHMPLDDAANILREISRERADRILGAMGESAEDVERLLVYAEDTAGAIMSPEYVSLPEDMMVKGAIEHLQSRQVPTEASFYVYVTDERENLVGVLSLRQLIMQAPDKHLRDCMVANPIRVSTDTDQEEVARLVARYDLLALPVVDATNRLLGVITVDDVIDVLREEATEDMLKMAGTTVEEVTQPNPVRGAWIRFPWLAASFVGGIFGIMLLDRFEGVLATTVQLAFFMPIILGMGGNVASQCAMIVVRGLATGRLEIGALGPNVARELATGLILAVTFGAGLAGLAVLFGYGPASFPIVVGLGISASMLIAATLGTFLPLVFRSLAVDPAIASGPVVTTSTDILGIAAFFLVAHLLL
jgi:magnesium transporter